MWTAIRIWVNYHRALYLWRKQSVIGRITALHMVETGFTPYRPESSREHAEHSRGGGTG